MDRRPTQRKRKHPGKKCLRGQPLLYEELKRPLKLRLTASAIGILESLALKEQISMSEFIEQLMRGAIDLHL
jgi:hypothetical protein